MHRVSNGQRMVCWLLLAPVLLILCVGCGDEGEDIVEVPLPPEKDPVVDVRMAGIGVGFIRLAWSVPQDEAGRSVGPFHLYQAVGRPVDPDSLEEYVSTEIPVQGAVGEEFQWEIMDVPYGARIHFGVRAEYSDGEVSELSGHYSVMTPKPMGEVPADASDITLSPDGLHIAYVERTLGYPDRNTIHVRPLAGHNPWLLESGSREPDWNPDGVTLAYTRTDQSSAWVYGEPASGGSPMLIFIQARSPAWSSDGKSIAAMVYEPTWGGSVHVLRIRPENPKSIIEGTAGLEPRSWSPDSRYIACSVWGEKTEIAVIDVEDSGIDRHTLDYEIHDARWSPVDSLIAVDSADGIRFLGFPSFQDMGLTVGGYYPNWLPSGKEILFFADARLWAVEIPPEWGLSQ